MTQVNYYALSKRIHADAVEAGWWADWPEKADRYRTMMMWSISEMGEAAMGHIKGRMDSKLPQYPEFHVELGDVFIVLMDSIGSMGVPNLNRDMQGCVNQALNTLGNYPTRRPVEQLEFAIAKTYTSSDITIKRFRILLGYIVAISIMNNVPLSEIVEEKLAFNKGRKDHAELDKSKAR